MNVGFCGEGASFANAPQSELPMWRTGAGSSQNERILLKRRKESQKSARVGSPRPPRAAPKAG